MIIKLGAWRQIEVVHVKYSNQKCVYFTTLIYHGQRSNCGPNSGYGSKVVAF